MTQIVAGGMVFGSAPDGTLGEVKMFALNISGSVTKTTLQAKGWAICDGTTAGAQGITNPTITASTPNLQNKFIRGSDNEASGATGGAETHNHGGWTGNANYPSGTGGTDFAMSGWWHKHTISSSSSLPSYYELVFFIKVRA